MTSTTATSQRLPLLVILAISLLGTIGMGIVFPVLPFILKPYVGSTGDLAFAVGAIDSVYAACALIAAPLLGALSDRIGRRPVLVVSLLGSAVGWAVFGIGGAIWVFVLARVVDGFTAGDMSVAFAYLADITPAKDRSKRFGLAGAVSGVGFLIGPALGGMLAPISLTLPVFLAAGITGLTALLALVVLPESLTPEQRAAAKPADLNPLRPLVDALRRPHLGPLVAGFGLLSLVMALMVTNLPVLALDAVGWQPLQIGLLLSGVGVMDIVVQGVLLGVLLKVMGERGVVLAGIAGMGVSSGMIALVGSVVPSGWVLLLASMILAIAQGASQATLQGLLSGRVGDEEQGWLAGGLSSINSATGLVGPLITGLLYQQVSRSAPYIAGVVAVVACLVLLRPALAGGASREGALPEVEPAA
jgi:DHA1 family tetracycline resistance protein-like MFS transporter